MLAARLLKQEGYRIIAQRLRVGRRDEFDIIARQRDGTFVFVEVKTRRTENFGRPADSVTRHKRHCLSRAALRYLRRCATQPPAIRFDVVEIIGAPDGAPPIVRHIENAFPLDRCYRI